MPVTTREFSSSRFTWSSGRGSAELSDLRSVGKGFDIRSERTGIARHFHRVDEKRDHDGELLYITFANHDRSVAVDVFND